MPQHLPDPHDRHPGLDHLARRRVAQPVRADLRDPGAPARAADRRGDRPGRDRRIRSPGLQEHLPPIARRPPAPQVRGDRLAHISRQRQPVLATALAADHELTSAPVDVIKRQAGDLAAAQPQPQQQDDQRVIAPPERAGDDRRSPATPARPRG